MAFCLPQDIANKLLDKFKTGKINPEMLANMTSAERREFFGKYMSEAEAKQTNALLESKLLLKDVERGLVTWAKQVVGLKPEVKRDLLTKISKMTEILEPKEMNMFLEDLAATKLGVTVTAEEARTISQLSKMVAEAKDLMTQGKNRLDYGRKAVAFYNHINELKEAAGKITPKEALKNPIKLLSDAAGTAKSLRASMDNSAIFRQGWKTLWTNPIIWQRNARKSFVDIWRTFGGKKVMDELNADIISRKNALNGYYKKANLAVTTIEEEFPGIPKLLQKIPVFGRAYKAAETAFTAFVYRQRVDVFDKYIEIARKSGVKLNDIELKSIGKMVNSLTGRGHLGRVEPVAGIINNVFFSPRLLKSNIDVLTAHQLQRGVSPFVRKQAAYNLLKIISGTAAVLVIADAIRPGSVEWDPRSADFGKIKIGSTRFDVSGGMSSIITLAARLATQSSKSSTTGLITELRTGEYGAMTGVDVIYNFFENKLSPAGAVIKDLLSQETFDGNKPTLTGEVVSLTVPLIAENYWELKEDPQSANVLISMIAEALGISVNTYSPTTNWEQSTSKEMKQFKEKVGDDKFKEANNNFNQQFNDWFSGIKNTDKYKNLSDDDKQKVITNKKAEIKEKVFKQFNFRFKQEKAKKLPKF